MEVTKRDVKEAVANKVEEEFLNSAVNRVKKVQLDWYKKPDEIEDICPWCNEQRKFSNTRDIVEMLIESLLLIV